MIKFILYSVILLNKILNQDGNGFITREEL